MIKRSLDLVKYLLFVATIITSCSQPEKAPYTPPENARSLIAGDSAKVWKVARRFNNETRMNMGHCFLAYRQTYLSDMTMHDNNGEQRDCGETLHAQWRLIKDQHGNYYIKWISDQLPSIMNIEEDQKYFKILHLAADELIVQFKHQQFSNKTTTITDIYVPEHLSVEDREFHW